MTPIEMLVALYLSDSVCTHVYKWHNLILLNHCYCQRTYTGWAM